MTDTSERWTEWRFAPLDTWFFREARGFDTSGSNELSSLFPPPARTVAGAIRTRIGEAQGVDWAGFPDAADCTALRAVIGVGDDLGQLRLQGPYPRLAGERLYPVPRHLLSVPDTDAPYRFLRPGDPVDCDLGRVRLPKLDPAKPGAKPLDNAWLTAGDLQRVLQGEHPQRVIEASTLYTVEPRLGIGRHNRRRTGIDGLLYQTRHLRLHAEVTIGAATGGIPQAWQPATGTLRFGGEGRAAAFEVSEAAAPLATPASGTSHLLLVLLTPADFGADHWLLPGFTAARQDGIDVWQGELNGIPLTLHSAVIGKPTREGGWDLAKQAPRPVESLVPAGSVYFCTAPSDPAQAVNALHGHCIGSATALGRGELAVGVWQTP